MIELDPIRTLFCLVGEAVNALRFFGGIFATTVAPGNDFPNEGDGRSLWVKIGRFDNVIVHL